MEITLLNISSKKNGFLNKDTAGGYGHVSHFGDSFISKLLTFVKKWGINYPPLAMGYLAGVFKENGHEVEVLSNAVLKSQVSSLKSDLVIIYSSIVDFKAETEVASLIRKRTKARVGFVGPFASVKPEIFLPHSDFVIRGEPEDAAMRISNDWIPQGAIDSQLIEDLDSLPFPDWDVFPKESFSYKPYFPFSKGKSFFPILSSRGCNFSCAYYCPYTVIAGRRWRKRSPENVVAEVEHLVKHNNAGMLLFRDPIFTLDRRRVLEIAHGIIEKGIDINYVCETHLTCLDKELIDVLYESGLRAIKVGIESVSEKVLKSQHRKPIDVQHQEDILSYCDEKGISVTAFYMFGQPEDTEESIRTTIECAKKLNTIGVLFSICTPYPGTRFYDDIEEQLITKDYEQYTNYTPVFKHNNLTREQLLRLKSQAYTTYFLRPAWVAKAVKKRLL